MTAATNDTGHTETQRDPTAPEILELSPEQIRQRLDVATTALRELANVIEAMEDPLDQLRDAGYFVAGATASALLYRGRALSNAIFALVADQNADVQTMSNIVNFGRNVAWPIERLP